MTKYEKISVLARETAKEICANREEWIRYLDVASRLYKYPFEEQILIYAQRPDATACVPLEMWNEKMFCWVNRGAEGIALIDGESERPRLRYVFDVSDVHKAKRIGKEPFIWKMKEEHQEVILAELEKVYGSTDANYPFESRIYEIAKRVADDFYEEILDDLIDVAANSYLEDLNGDSRAKNLMKLDVPRWEAYKIAYNGDRYARLAHNGWVQKAISTKRLTSFGLVSMLDYYTERCVTC